MPGVQSQPLPVSLPAASLPPAGGLTAGASVAATYETILDADFESLPAQLTAICPPAPPEVCLTLQALGRWWEIALEPESRQRDTAFSRIVNKAIASTDAWTRREPDRAEAWFYRGAAYGVRVQWRVLREERLAAARDGKRIKEALEQALALDPALHDAKFGLGMYRYYAAVAPAALRMLRWLLLLPGGDRDEGLRQMIEARNLGEIVHGETDYQLHLVYLWYEDRSRDALAIIRSLQERFPRNPLFHHIEAEIHAVYFHDATASLAASTRLLALADANRVHEPQLASVRAQLNMAAIDLLEALVIERPLRPHGARSRAQALLNVLTSKR